MKELAAVGIPVAVTCRVLKLSRQPYYRWLASPVTAAELAQAYRANALFNAHQDDPEFGYRFLVDEARDAGEVMCERSAWRICRDNNSGVIGRVPSPSHVVHTVVTSVLHSFISKPRCGNAASGDGSIFGKGF